MIRCFITHNRMPNANALLRLYLTKAIRWSPNSVRTLRLLCERVSLPEDAFTSVLDPSPSATTAPICDRTRLLEWLLNASWEKLVTRLSDESIENYLLNVCALLVDLILSSRCRQSARKSSRKREESRGAIFVRHQNICSTDLPRLCHASLIFKLEFSAKSKDGRDEQDFRLVTTDGNPVFYVQEALNFLKQRLCVVLQVEDANDETRSMIDVHIVLMKIALLARSLSNLKQLGIIAKEDTVDPLIDVMEKNLKNSFEVLARINWSRCENLDGFLYFLIFIVMITL